MLESPFHIAKQLVRTNHKLSECITICTILSHRMHIFAKYSKVNVFKMQA